MGDCEFQIVESTQKVPKCHLLLLSKSLPFRKHTKSEWRREVENQTPLEAKQVMSYVSDLVGEIIGVCREL